MNVYKKLIRTAPLTALLLFASVAAGCGVDEKPQRASLILDFTPNAVHSGLYRALKDGLYEQAGVNLKIREPSTSSDSLKLVESGKADFAIADIHDIGIAREKGLDIVGVVALVERPLASVLALKKSGVESPGELDGKKVGVTGLPSDVAVLNSEVENSGGDPQSVDQITIGFNAVGSLIGGKVDAATGFWNAEGVTLESEGHPVNIFKVDEYGAPSYPELVVITSKKTANHDPALVHNVVSATIDGYERTLDGPGASLSALISETKGLDRKIMKEQLDALMPAFKGEQERVGILNQDVLKEWAAWDVKFGILKRKLDTREAFTNRFQE